jgi:dTDP-4-amino-4,6-dideoxygalactose transaminase
MKLPIIRPNVDKFKAQIKEDIEKIIQSNMLTNVNIYTLKFEDLVKRYIGSNEIVAVSSATSGLILALDAMGVRDKEIILPSFTFAATAASAYWTHNRIVYADIDMTFTLDIEDVRRKITKDTGAILPVHMYGNPARIKELEEISEEYDTKLLFDAAHALGSQYFGKRCGNFGDAEVFSLSPTKLLTTVEGGIISSKDSNMAGKIRLMRNYGLDPNYESEQPGLNARMSEIHAAIGISQVEYIDEFVRNRNRYVDLYKRLLGDLPGIQFQEIPKGHLSTHKDFSIVINKKNFGMDRDTLAIRLEKEGISTKKYFYPPLHRLKAYRDTKVNLPITDKITDNVLSLPIYNYMTEEDIEGCCEAIKKCRYE